MLWRYNSCLEVEANGQACTFIKRAFEIMDVSVWGGGGRDDGAADINSLVGSRNNTIGLIGS